MMAVSPSLFAFLLVVAHLVILDFAAASEKYQRNCPESFDSCGSTATGKIKFPFTNDTYPGCGLCAVNCSGEGPRIRLVGQQEWHKLKEIRKREEIIIIPKNNLRKLSSSRDCGLFNDLLPLPSTPSISFNTIYPPLKSHNQTTLFKCSGSPDELDPQITDYFLIRYYFRQDCPGFTVYYRNPTTEMPPIDPPNGCTAIQLPILTSTDKPISYDVFSILDIEDVDFSIHWDVSEQCGKCRNDRGQCSHDQQKFHCLKDGGRMNYVKWILVGTGVLAAGIVIVVLFFCRFSKSVIFGKKDNMINQNVYVILKKWGLLAPKRYSYSDIKKMTCSFKEKLGQGGYGTVYKGNFKTGDLIAVKVLNKSRGNVEEFINEVTNISKTSHINIVSLLGFCLEGNKRALVYEFMPNGSLEKFMHDENSSAEYRILGWETLYQIAIGIARGLEYLHSDCNTRILHLDIKPQNILLDEDFCPKISDFGLAKICPRKKSIISMSGIRGTAGYIAPKVFSRNFGGVSHKSDAYSYGMMLLNMVVGGKNVDDRDHSSEQYFPDWIYRRLELGSEIGQHDIMNGEDNEKARKMTIVGLWCIQINPSDRPAMSKVLDMLVGSLESLQIPPRPFFSSPQRTLANMSTDTLALSSSTKL